jgi:hypothetical protein
MEKIKKIIDFKEIFDWIVYDYDSHYELKRNSAGDFYVNKLTIGKNYLSYKTEHYDIEPDLYYKVEKLYSLFHENSIRYMTED